jgi:hypothetical protein
MRRGRGADRISRDVIEVRIRVPDHHNKIIVDNSPLKTGGSAPAAERTSSTACSSNALSRLPPLSQEQLRRLRVSASTACSRHYLLGDWGPSWRLPPSRSPTSRQRRSASGCFAPMSIAAFFSGSASRALREDCSAHCCTVGRPAERLRSCSDVSCCSLPCPNSRD